MGEAVGGQDSFELFPESLSLGFGFSLSDDLGALSKGIQCSFEANLLDFNLGSDGSLNHQAAQKVMGNEEHAQLLLGIAGLLPLELGHLQVGFKLIKTILLRPPHPLGSAISFAGL